MIIVQVKENENIEKALKKFKRKFEKTGIVKELRARKESEKQLGTIRRRWSRLSTFRSSVKQSSNRGLFNLRYKAFLSV